MSEPAAEKCCPKCGATNLVSELPGREYRCGDCGTELAHLDTLATGAVRGVLGWLLESGTEVHERYRVAALLGKGGFGATYLVDDMRLHGKRRALKEVPELLFDEYETRLLGRLNHPAIPDITDRFTDNGMVYQVLEFGGDRTLRIEQERRGGRIPLFVLLPWIRQLCDALAYLHGQEPPVVHRDLKPDNILLDDNDRIMLIDFGIAKEAAPDTATRTIGRAVTQGFSPPEQVLGTGTDARSDVYALGAIMYHLLTGQMPPAAHERITGRLIEPLTASLPECPLLIQAAVMKALELNINLRQQSIAEFAESLDLVLAGSGSKPTVSIAGEIHASGPAATGGVVLPSVQLPSSRSTGGASAPGSLRIGGLAAEPTTTEPGAARKRVGPALAAFVLLLGISGGVGLWFWQAYQKPGVGTASNAAAPQGDVPPATTEALADRPPAGAPASSAANGNGLSTLPSQHPGGVNATATGTDGALSPADAAAGRNPDATSTLEIGSAAAVAAAAATAAKSDAAAARETSPNPRSVATSAPMRLSSIFSDEQRNSTPAATRSKTTIAPTPTGASLMDVFNKHRGVALSTQPAEAEPPAAAASPEPKQATAGPAPKPAPKTTTAKPTPKRKVAAKPKPRPKSSSSGSGSSGWGFEYKGAKKKY